MRDIAWERNESGNSQGVKSVRKPSQLLPAATIDSARDAQEILAPAAALLLRTNSSKGHAIMNGKGRAR